MTLATCAEPVAAGAPAAGVDEVIVVGHSLGDDLDDAQVAWCPARLVPEAPGLLVEPVHLAPPRSASIARSWVRTGATSSCRRRRSRPAELAAVLDGIAAATAG